MTEQCDCCIEYPTNDFISIKPTCKEIIRNEIFLRDLIQVIKYVIRIKLKRFKSGVKKLLLSILLTNILLIRFFFLH